MLDPFSIVVICSDRGLRSIVKADTPFLLHESVEYLHYKMFGDDSASVLQTFVRISALANSVGLGRKVAKILECI